LPRASTGIVAIIPARGGSKGIPRKNLQPLCGKPLIAYSIEAALAARLVERVVVSTDDEEIAEVSRRYGAEVPFLRPSALARGSAIVGDVVSHVVDQLAASGWRAFAQATLYPTHPFRAQGLIDQLLERLFSRNDTVFTVRRLTVRRHTFFVPGGEGLRPLATDPSVGGPYPGALHRAYGLLHASVLSPRGKPGHAHEVTDPAALVDIDTPEDLRLAEAILRRGLFPARPGVHFEALPETARVATPGPGAENSAGGATA